MSALARRFLQLSPEEDALAEKLLADFEASGGFDDVSSVATSAVTAGTPATGQGRSYRSNRRIILLYYIVELPPLHRMRSVRPSVRPSACRSSAYSLCHWRRALSTEMSYILCTGCTRCVTVWIRVVRE